MNSENAATEPDNVVDSNRQRSQDHFEKLLADHRAYLRQLVDLRMDEAIRGRVDPSDIVQDAQIEALRRASEFAANPQIPFRLWMRQIAIDRLIMSYRKHVKAAGRTVLREISLRDNSSIEVAQQLVAEFASPSVQVLQDEVVRSVRAAVAQLNDQDREIILLLAFEKLTSSEAAQVLDIEPATARKRFGRALLRLKKLLVESGIGGSRDEGKNG